MNAGPVGRNRVAGSAEKAPIVGGFDAVQSADRPTVTKRVLRGCLQNLSRQSAHHHPTFRQPYPGFGDFGQSVMMHDQAP